MKITTLTMVPDLDRAGSWAREAERLGFDGVFMAEGKRDPFLSLSRATAASERIEIGTGIALAFTRSPMQMAYTAQELQHYSRGRLVLGLGPQVKTHVTRRFAMPFDPVLTRMREYVRALRAIWDCWNLGKRLDFRGSCYRINLMIPMFKPPPHDYGHPKIFLAVTGPKMAELAGEIADGIILHGIASPRYIRETIMPCLQRGLERAGRQRRDLEIVVSPRIATGADEAVRSQNSKVIRRQLAFYASTPEYRPILDTHGRIGLHAELARLAARGEWEAMGTAFDEGLLEDFAVVAPPEDVARILRGRYRDICTRVSVDDTDIGTDLRLWKDILLDLHQDAVPHG